MATTASASQSSPKSAEIVQIGHTASDAFGTNPDATTRGPGRTSRDLKIK